MKLGALLNPVPPGASTTALADHSRRLAGEGFTSLWTPQAIGRGMMMTDPFIALTVAATVAEEVEIGTAVIQVPLYQPMDLAHRVFSLMQLCGDRLIFGVGAGSTEKDFNAFDRPFEKRFRTFNHALATLREIFETGGANNSDLSPWPEVKGGPPVYFGSWGNGVERAAKDFDGWIASAHYRTSAEVVAALERYRRNGGGRAIVSTIILNTKTDLGETRDKLAQFADAGFDDAVVMFTPGAPKPAVIRALLEFA